MGYTHYAYIESRDIPDDEWNALCNEVLALNMERLGELTINDKLIQVRGDCEWFHIPRSVPVGYRGDTQHFTFTKTDRRDYDYIVVACYMALYRCVRGVKLSSDGEWAELQAGRDHYKDTLGLTLGDLRKAFSKTIHDPRQKWFIGNPIYACDKHDKSEWYDFLSHTSDLHHDDGTGISFIWKWDQRVVVYNTENMGNTPVVIRHDGEEHRIELGDCFAILPAPLFDEHSIKDFDTSAGRYAIVWASSRPVFEFDKNDFPRMTYTIDMMTGVDTSGHSACEACGDWVEDRNIWHDAEANHICADCHGDDDEGEEY